ncbi:glycerate kinase [Microbacterium saperdae]|uniref:Glycerate kinase n=1 Tax=Microbacterium saperdae TaxID=69368 RepID=A0A543BIE5_9MICO|nr:glycerate kinase [Microbacterium saperdae]TQL84622.1 glycerate kinase [Microbacterium saperdae]GGM61773.1 glycerate kinase [Microbacterium saperdae]
MTRVVLAPDSFKGTITAADAAIALAAGWASVDQGAEFVHRPMADGGEGTVAAFEAAVSGSRRMPVTVDGPAGVPVDTFWLLLPPTDDAPNGTAVVDLGSTSGIELLDELRPWDADTSGFGQAIVAALDHGVSRLVLGIGSSASTDGGTGMLAALGARFLDVEGVPVARGARGLAHIAAVDLGALRPAPEVRVLTDVTNPLTGPRGAAAVFGPQKGLVDEVDSARVDDDLVRLAALLELDAALPGVGAAGGTGGALVVWGGVLAPGAAEVAELIGLAAAIADADVVITGEGSYDGQSGDGKVPSFLASLAVDAGARAMLAAGRITADSDTSLFAASASLTDLAGSSAAALAEPAQWLRAAGAALARSAR